MSSVLTVSQLNRYVGFKIKSDVKLKGIAVKGEISNLSVNYKSGHIYFSLKDEEGLVKAVMFSSNAAKLKFSPENGMNVIAFGNIDVYERDGVYQLVVSEIQPLGVGIQQLSLDALKNKLKKLGVFDSGIKRNICDRPEKIAVVTSATGAALQDILNIISRRCPVCRIVVFPTLVQGENAPDMISQSLFKADREEADTIILARGGGSAEDLSAFNTEKVVMAVYNCSTPVISAVGHETDTTLADYASDLRAPTPSAAAEIAVPDISAVVGDIDRKVSYVKMLVNRKISEHSGRIALLENKLNALSPASELQLNISKIDNALQQVNNAFFMYIEKLDKALCQSASKLSALNPFAVMERGYSVVLKDKNAVKNSNELAVGDEISLRFAVGEATAKIQEIKT